MKQVHREQTAGKLVSERMMFVRLSKSETIWGRLLGTSISQRYARIYVGHKVLIKVQERAIPQHSSMVWTFSQVNLSDIAKREAF